MVEYDEIMETNIQPKVRFEFLVFFYSLYLSLILVCFPCFPVVVDDVVVVVVVVVVVDIFCVGFFFCFCF